LTWDDCVEDDGVSLASEQRGDSEAEPVGSAAAACRYDVAERHGDGVWTSDVAVRTTTPADYDDCYKLLLNDTQLLQTGLTLPSDDDASL